MRRMPADVPIRTGCPSHTSLSVPPNESLKLCPRWKYAGFVRQDVDDPGILLNIEDLVFCLLTRI